MNRSADRAIVVIAVLATAFAIHFAAEFLVPATLSLVLVSLLWPLVQRLARWRVPTPVGAPLTVLGAVAIFVTAIAALGAPLNDFVDQIPKSIEAARPKIAAMTAKMNQLTRIKNAPVNVGDSTNRKRDTASTQQRDTTNNQQRDTTAAAHDAVTSPSGLPSGAPATITHALGVAGGLLGEFVEIVLLTLFILAAGMSWQRKLEDSVDAPAKRTAAADTVTEMRSVVSRYVLVTTLINIAQGTIVGLVLYFLDFPSPLLWGVLTFAFEFVPYFGGMVVIALLTVVGLANGRGFPAMLAAPAAYLLITSLQNNVLSPIVYGKGMRLNPTAILAGLMLWYMLWGVAGAFLAVPILAAFNVLATRVPSLKPVHVFLSE